MTEYASRRSRGRQVASMFSAYTFGQIAAFMIALTLLAAGVNHDLAWRLMLGLGALPALGVLYNRRRMPESPRYTAAVAGDPGRARVNSTPSPRARSLPRPAPVPPHGGSACGSS